MTSAQLETKLRELMSLPAETEWVEFKQAKSQFHFEELGKYFSALSNETNLKHQPHGWIIFGVSDKPPRQVVGTHYRPNRPALDKLKDEIAQGSSNQLTFIDIHELVMAGKRVLMFQIPPALEGIPTSWKGHFYGRNGESLGALNLAEIEQIRAQRTLGDWSGAFCEEAEIDDLDPEAIAFARKQYTRKNSRLAEEIDAWDTLTFLNKTKVCINGRITRAALVLLARIVHSGKTSGCPL